MDAIIISEEPDKKVELKEKVFKSGSRGFFGNSVWQYRGKTYQVNILLYEKGSKPAGSTEDDEGDDDEE